MKTRFLLGVLLLFSITMQGQQVKVNYENITNSLPIILQEYFRMQGVQHLNLTIKGEFNGKRAKLKKISCNNGVFTERELLPDFVHFILVDSVETLDFMVVVGCEWKCIAPTTGNGGRNGGLLFLESGYEILYTFV